MNGARSPNINQAIIVKADTAQLGQVRRFVEEVGAQLSLDHERVFDLKVAVSEACANAVEHAGGKATPLKVCACTEGERLTFTVSDSGRFCPPCPSRRDRLGISGLGLPLMVALMDEVTFAHAPGGGTTVRLSVLLDHGPSVHP